MGIESRPISHGEDSLRNIEKEGALSLPIESPAVQIKLAQAAFPELAPGDAVMKWAEEDDHAWSAGFRTYVEKHQGESIDIRDPKALAEMLTHIRPPETLH